MSSLFAEKKPDTNSRSVANQLTDNKISGMAAVPALQRMEVPEDELQMKPAQLKKDTIQKQGDGEEEELLQGKFLIQKQVVPEEEEPMQMKAFQLKSGTVQKEGIPEEEMLQKKPFQLKADTVQKAVLPEAELPVQDKFEPVQKKENKTGLPDNLKSGVEQLSGHSLDDVSVHYNSSQPAQLNALAYAQGTDIHVGPGQEQHLPHEAWHVAQQKQGRVQPTMQMKAGVAVNDDPGLENEADVMGAKAVQMKTAGSHGKSCGCSACCTAQLRANGNISNNIVQKVSANINVHTQTSPLTGKVAQLTDASVFVNSSSRGTGHCGIGEGVGGRSHAEQLAWRGAKGSVDGKFDDAEVKNVVVNFTVDQTICVACQDWFEKTLYKYFADKSEAKNKKFELWVEVDGIKVRINGEGETDWPEEVGDEERGFLLDDLKSTLVETGGMSEDKIMVYKKDGETKSYPYYSEEGLDTLLREKRFEIKASKENWKNFQETGMTLVGDRQQIDLDEVHNENEENFEYGRR